MPRIPFSRTLDDLFQSDKSVGLKMLGGAIATPFIVLAMLLSNRGNNRPELPPVWFLGMVAVGSVIAGAFLGLALSLKDSVEQKMASGQPVHWLLRNLFGRRGVSIAIWFVIALFLTPICCLFIFR